jgi:hypothetical protein
MSENNVQNVYVRTLQERSHINLPKSVLERLKFNKFVQIIVNVNTNDITVKPLELN